MLLILKRLIYITSKAIINFNDKLPNEIPIFQQILLIII